MTPNAEDQKSWYADVPRSALVPTVLGLVAATFTVVGFGVWAGTAPIAGAVVATGAFVTTGQNKIVQHLEGGVIREIKVREGDVVEQGQTLVLLDETAPRVELRRLVLRRARLAAMEARLSAEMQDRPQVTFAALPAGQRQDPEAAAAVEQQRLTFEARRKNLMSEIATHQAGIEALEERLSGSRIQLKSVQKQLVIIEEELNDKSFLLLGGHIRKPEVLTLRRAQANLQGEIGRLTGEIGDARERIVRAQQQIAMTRSTAAKQAADQIHEVQGELNDVAERIRQAQGVLERITIVAPVRGVVVKMRYHTASGVVESGKSVLEIVPLNEGVIIEVRIQPRDIATVKRGQPAAVRLTALNARTTPMIAGEVVYVSADALPDDKRGPSATSDVYVAHIKLDPQDAAKVPDFTPSAGMPAEVYIKTAERTFFQYLMKPIEDSMSRAFRET